MRIKFLNARLRTKDLPSDSPDGSVQAMFSVFNVIDSSGEVVQPTFFTDGQEIALSSWGHRWDNLPVGKGIIRVTPEGAVFDGRFFTETQAGAEHYKTVKAMGDLQEWSFGFRVLDAMPGVLDGRDAIFLTRGEIYEVSPVLVGDNRETFTQAIKGMGVQAWSKRFEEALEIKSDSQPTDPPKGQTFESEVDQVLAAVAGVLSRAKSIQELRAKEGRAISTSRREQLGNVSGKLREGADIIDAMLKETEPTPKGEEQSDVKSEDLATILELERLRSERFGVRTVAGD